MSDYIREALAEIIRDNSYPGNDDEFVDLSIADLILKRFLVISRDQVGTEQGFPHAFGPIESRDVWRGPWTNSIQNHESAP